MDVRNGSLLSGRKSEADIWRPSSVRLHYILETFPNHLFSDLEKAVEDLSQLIDASVEEETYKALREKVINKTVLHVAICNSRADIVNRSTLLSAMKLFAVMSQRARWTGSGNGRFNFLNTSILPSFPKSSRNAIFSFKCLIIDKFRSQMYNN